MSTAEIERFAADLKSNEALRAEAGKAQADKSRATSVDRAVAFAASKGYAFTADELKDHAKATARAAGKELTDAELDGVAGGIAHPSAAVRHHRDAQERRRGEH
jgi:predicted ribosomally synthesized peptide with nif11-like leader